MATRAKLAIILHADVVGSTALVQVDESAAHERIRGTFRHLAEAVASHDGTAHEVRGDALVAEFARPSDAVLAAARFQDEAGRTDAASAEPKPVPVRIGIAMGEVIVADGTVTGAGVVLAQRLEQLAAAGGVAISAAVREAVSGSLPVAYTDLGEQRLKGFDQPQRAFAGLSQGKYMAAINLWDPRAQALAQSLAHGRSALELDERDPRALRFYGGCECLLGRLDDGIRMLRRAVTVQPSYATAYSALAFGLALNGEFEDAVTAEGTTRRLRPGERSLHKCMMSRAIATYEVGDYVTAAKVCEDSLAIADTFWMSHLMQAAALGQLDRREKAIEAVTRLRGFMPTLDRALLGQMLPFRRVEHLEHLVEGLARAGLALH